MASGSTEDMKSVQAGTGAATEELVTEKENSEEELHKTNPKNLPDETGDKITDNVKEAGTTEDESVEMTPEEVKDSSQENPNDGVNESVTNTETVEEEKMDVTANKTGTGCDEEPGNNADLEEHIEEESKSGGNEEEIESELQDDPISEQVEECEETDEQSAVVSDHENDSKEGKDDQLSLEVLDDPVPEESTAQEKGPEDDQDDGAKSSDNVPGDPNIDNNEEAVGSVVEQTDPDSDLNVQDDTAEGPVVEQTNPDPNPELNVQDDTGEGPVVEQPNPDPNPELNVQDDTEDGLQEPDEEIGDEMEESQGNMKESSNKDTSENMEEGGNNADDLLSDTAGNNDMQVVEEGIQDNIDEADSNEEKENVLLADPKSENVTDSNNVYDDASDNGMEISDLTNEKDSNIEMMETAESDDNINTEENVEMAENEDTKDSNDEIVDETSNTPEGNDNTENSNDEIVDEISNTPEENDNTKDSNNEIVDEISNTPEENDNTKDSNNEIVDETSNTPEENDNTKDSNDEIVDETSNTPEENDNTKDSNDEIIDETLNTLEVNDNTKDSMNDDGVGETLSPLEENVTSADECMQSDKVEDVDNQNVELNKDMLNSEITEDIEEKKNDDYLKKVEIPLEEEDSNDMTDILKKAGYEIDTNSKHEVHDESSVDSDRVENELDTDNEVVNNNQDETSEGIQGDLEEMDSNEGKDEGSVERDKVKNEQDADNEVVKNNTEEVSEGIQGDLEGMDSNEGKDEGSVERDKVVNEQDADNELVKNNEDEVLSEGIQGDFEEMDSSEGKDGSSIKDVKVETRQETDNVVINNNQDGSSQGSLGEMEELHSNEVKDGLKLEDAVDVKDHMRIEEDIEEISIDKNQPEPVNKTTANAIVNNMRVGVSSDNTKTEISNTEQAMDVDELESTSNKAYTEVDKGNESEMEVSEESSVNKEAVENTTGETSDTALTEKSNESSGGDGSFGLMEEGIKKEGVQDGMSELKIVGVTSAVGKDDATTDLTNDFDLKIDSVSGADDPKPKASENSKTGEPKSSSIKQEKQVDKTETLKETKNATDSKAEEEDDDVIAVKEEKKPPPPKPKASKIQKCIVCSKIGKCKYNIVRNGDVKHLCDDTCFKQFRGNPTAYLKQAENDKNKQSEPTAKNGTQTPAGQPAAAKLKSLINTAQLQKPTGGEPYKTCTVCQLMNVRTSKPFLNWQGLDYCGEECLGKFQGNLSSTCNYCSSQINQSNKAKFCARIGEEVKHFCSQTCNTEFVKRIKACAFCNKDLAKENDSFMAPVGNEGMFKDFCSQSCLLKYEDKNGKDLDVNGELVRGMKTAVAPSGNFSCSVCSKVGPVKHEMKLDNKVHRLCSDPCFSAFQYANKLTLNSCDNCGTSCFNESGAHFVQFEGKQKRFCSFMCVNAFRNQKKKPTPCAWCGAKKSNFDMIERVDSSNKFQLFCSLNCLSLYRVNLQATSNQAVLCDQCRKFVPAQYHLTMSDASVRNFCSYGCVMSFQSQFTNPPNPKQVASLANQKQVVSLGNQKQVVSVGNQKQVVSVGNQKLVVQPSPVNQQVTTTRSGRVVTRGPKQQQYVTQQPQPQTRKETTIKPNKVNQESFPIISNVVSLAPQGSQQQINIKSPANVTVLDQQSGKTIATSNAGNQTVQQQIIIQPPPPKTVKNKSMLCKPFVQTKATSCRPHTQHKETQTDGKPEPEKIYIPVPIPIYCPTPLAMYSIPTPILIPVPVPIPIPVFIPTTKKSAASILKHIKEIQEKIPADPLEAELLMMAEAVAGKGEESSSDSDEGETEVPPTKEATPANNSGGVLGEDMLQMALRMASEMSDEPVMDLENSLEPVAVNTEPPAPPSATPVVKDPEPDEDDEYVPATRSKRGRGGSAKRPTKATPRRNPKRQRTDVTPQPQIEEPSTSPPAPQAPPPDANFHLKYTYGVNAFKHWVTQKNGQIDQTPKPDIKHKAKTFKTDILQCTADELNYALCLFVKEVRKPNGEEYAVDSIFYLCLGIQQYLFENGRIDNVFTDMYYERFTECLNELLCRYEPKLNHAGQLVCRIEEEHLWESKQLGAHSPHVLLNTLVYFNTKYFMLKTSEDHLKLSFTHIMKHWKKTASGRGSGVGPNAGRSVYLRYYCPTPQNKENATKKKKEEMPVYEQTENLDNPLRCPVKLYEFYLSKCPESIKNRNDTFYLVPERSCVPDSPVWYSTAMLGVDAMAKMLNRIRLVREIQEAHLHTQPIYI